MSPASEGRLIPKGRNVPGWRVVAAAYALLLVAIAAVPLSAHVIGVELKAFFKVEGGVLRILLRLPSSVLSDAGLTTVTSQPSDQTANDVVLRAVALDAAKNLDVMSGNRRLPSPSAKWVVSSGADLSFDSYQSALARLAGPALPTGGEIYWNDAFVDLQLDYPIGSVPEGLSIRFNGFRTPTGFVQTTATYLPSDGGARQFTVIGTPRRVTLEPSRREAIPIFATLGVEWLLNDRELLLFLLCLAIPRRSLISALGVFGAFLIGHVVSTVLIAVTSTPPDVFFQLLFALAATTALIIAALQNILSTRSGWVKAVGFGFGATKGVALGLAVRAALPLSGSHAALGAFAFVATTEVAAAWLLLLAQPLLQWLYRVRVPAGIVTIGLSLLPIHAGLHGLAENGQLLGDTRLANSSRAVGFALGHWPGVMLAFAFMVLLVVQTMSRAIRQEPHVT